MAFRRLSQALTGIWGQDRIPPRDLRVLFLFSLMTVAAYFWNLGLNNIWTPNEGFYADAAREMLDTGNFLDIYYNYELRFNKPPMLYWLIAFSGRLFGLSEWAIRLPSALAGLGTIWLVYLMGALLDSRKLGIAAALVMTFSFQFVINARYASPAVLLTFFFSLTLYLFLLGYHRARPVCIWLSWIALGLTVLTKGYPYIIVITAIAGLYVLIDMRFDWRRWWRALWSFYPIPGLLIVLAIGMSWPLYAYLKYGDLFYQVFMDETFRRAVTRESSMKPFYYLEANSWGFLPYSLTFYLGLIYLVVKREQKLWENRALALGLSWFVVMLVIFTLAKGKIPTYFIQGHPGMALFTGFFILRFIGKNALWARIFRWSYIIPGVLFTLGGYAIVYLIGAHPLWYLLAALPVGALVFGYVKDSEYLKVAFFPFYSFLVVYLLFSAIVLPFMERDYRVQDEMGQAIRLAVPDANVPVLILDQHLHNLPFYAERKIYPYQSPEDIQAFITQNEALALVPKTYAETQAPGAEVIWEGPFYEGSETRTLEFILEVLKARDGEESRFTIYQVLHFPKEG